MNGRWAEKLSFVAGAAMGSGRVLIVAVPDEFAERREEVSVLLDWQDGTWEFKDRVVAAAPVAIASATGKKPSVLSLGYWGELYEVDASGARESSIAKSLRRSERSFGPMRGLCSVGEFFFAVGMGRVAFVRTGDGSWKDISPADDEDASVDPIGFQAVAGGRQDDVYAVGFGGDIWHFDGERFNPSVSPTNMLLNAVHVTPNGTVLIAGKAGILLIGRDGMWDRIEHDATDLEFFSLQWFQEHLYLATTQAVFLLEGDTIELVDFGEAGPATCFHLFESGGTLWSVGAKDILRFDGSRWTRIE